MVDLESPACRKRKRGGNTVIPMYMSLCEVAAVVLYRYCWTVYSAGTIVQIVFRKAHTHTHVCIRRYRSWLSQREDLEVQLLWLPRLTKRLERGLTRRYTAAAYRTA